MAMDRGFVDTWLSRLARWVELHPVAGSSGLAQVADEIVAILESRGFWIERLPHPEGDLIVASRPGHGPRLGLYGHYDVEPGGSTRLQQTEERIFGRGVADNLGPLALRLSALERTSNDELNALWIIEPGEERGSPALAGWLEQVEAPQVALWLDETGYFEAHDTQRVLLVDPDHQAFEVARRCHELANEHGRSTRVEHRRLHRAVPQAGFSVEALFRGKPYLALGPNDLRSNVHGDDESLPLDTIELSALQFHVVLEMFSAEAPR